VLLVVIRVHAQVVEGKLLLYLLLERSALLERERIRLGNNRHHINKLAQLLQHHDIDGLETVSRRLDEEQAAVDAGVLQVPLALGGQFLAQVGRVLVFDIFDDGVPAALVVNQVAVARGIDDVEAEPDTIFLDYVRDGLDFGGAADGLVGLQAAFAVDEVRGEDCVDEGGFAEAGLAWDGVRRLVAGQGQLGKRVIRRTDAHDIELKTALQQLLFNLLGDAVETDVALGEHRLRGLRVQSCHCCGLWSEIDGSRENQGRQEESKRCRGDEAREGVGGEFGGCVDAESLVDTGKGVRDFVKRRFPDQA
jgi:hypothetical protein